MTRAFTAEPVEPETVGRLVAAAFRGPSAGNSATLDLLVLRGPETQDYWDITLSDERRSVFPWPGLLVAPVLMIPTVEPDAYVRRYAEPDKAHTGLGRSATSWDVPYWWVDGGAAIENVLVGAAALHLGACFFGQFAYEPSIRERFAIPETRRCLGTIAIGHADQSAERPSRSSLRPPTPAEERTHWGRW